MPFYWWVFRLFGWAIGLGLLTGDLTYHDDGHTDGLTRALGAAVLLYWVITVGGTVLRNAREGQEERAYDAAVAAEITRHTVSQPSPARRQPLVAQPRPDLAAELARIAALHGEGALSDTEFQRAKNRLLQ